LSLFNFILLDTILVFTGFSHEITHSTTLYASTHYISTNEIPEQLFCTNGKEGKREMCGVPNNRGVLA
jgi:hypothetical protein